MLYSQFESILKSHIKSKNKIVLALSGGIDSSVLLHLLARYQHENNVTCIAVHIHHGLSPNADTWANLCRQWCQEYRIEYFEERVNLDIGRAQSIEAQAREARYAALANYIQPNDVLLTGQHLDDQSETFMLALKRGSGPKGLSSMASTMPFYQGTLIRPLLAIKRLDIETYAQHQQLNWVEDESNQDTRFDRNFLRHDVLPILSQRWPHISHSIARSAELCAEQEALLDELISSQYKSIGTLDNKHSAFDTLSIEKLEVLSPLLRRSLLRKWFERNLLSMPSRQQLQILWDEVALARQDATPSLRIGSIDARRFNGELYLVQPIVDLSNFKSTITVGQVCTLPETLGQVMINHTSTSTRMGMDIDKLKKGHDLWVHFNSEGLYAHPAERDKGRKVKKLFQEYKVPTWERRQIPILMCRDKVVAIAGLFVDKAYSGDSAAFQWHR
ncbi:tRNA lysidine(34) synthetase TilS [Vibrio sp.]|nr:tRNA lysidine(34) synthetase TilS [Vibrio sp.]